MSDNEVQKKAEHQGLSIPNSDSEVKLYNRYDSISHAYENVRARTDY